MNNDMSGKVTIITGGGKGIGFGIATAFAKAGSNLAITGRTESTLLKAKEELEDKYDVKVLPIVADGGYVKSSCNRMGLRRNQHQCCMSSCNDCPIRTVEGRIS